MKVTPYAKYLGIGNDNSPFEAITERFEARLKVCLQRAPRRKSFLIVHGPWNKADPLLYLPDGNCAQRNASFVNGFEEMSDTLIKFTFRTDEVADHVRINEKSVVREDVIDARRS
jgi:hypothetical protein